MSEHTKGRLSVEYQGLWYGYDLDTEDRVTLTEGLSEANARRLAACWNALEYLSTDQIEASTASRDEELNAARALIQQQDSLLGKKACATKECPELLAARALLREVSGATIGELQRLMPTIRSYLDACDTLGGNSEVGS